MNKFLHQVADFLYHKYNNQLVNLTVVFPNRRAGLFFQKYLSELVDKPIFSPHITTISEMVSLGSGLKLMDQNRLIIELYKVYGQVTNTTETLDEFFYWGEMMLSDFNDIDKYLVDAKQLFGNVESLRALDAGFDFLTEEQLAYLSTFWSNFLKARESDSKKQFTTIWKNLYTIYERFKTHLLAQDYAYEGLIYRQVAENLNNAFGELETSNFAFVGFNALNQCETKIFKFLQKNTTTNFFWDFDNYYMDDNKHEAALFMNANLQVFPMPPDFAPHFDNFSTLHQIDVVSVPGFSGQASLAASWIESNEKVLSPRFDNTAIVLCDETLLTGMLNVLPSNLGEFNITMGFPVKNSPVYAMVKGLVDIDKNSRPDPSGKPLFYYRNVLGLLSNPLIKARLGNFTELLLEKVKKENKIYLDIDDFKDQELLKLIFDLPESASDCQGYLQQIIKYVFAHTNDDEKLLKESLYQLYLSTNRLFDSLVDTEGKMAGSLSKKLFYQLLLRQLDRLMIPFEGEPLSGIQIMGFLETRCLDFDNLILLSFNDDKLPGNPHQHSFIPYSLRKGFGLPVIEQRNAMYAYYFYRLIQRAKNVSLVFDSRTDGMSKGEVSRFATQLKYEAKHLHINEKQAVFDFDPAEQQVISVCKDQNILAKIETYLTKRSVSPSALNTYIDCSLKFFFKYIEGISEIDDVAEDIDHLLFGRIAHVALEQLYQPFEGKTVEKSDVESLIANRKLLDKSLQYALEKEYFKGGKMNLNGRNLLVYDIIKKFVVRILKYDTSIAPFTLIALEKAYYDRYNITTVNGLLSVEVGGTIDRLDQVGDKIRVVDYKTGKADQNVKEIEKLFFNNASRNKAAFQTMIYAGGVVNTLNEQLPVLPAVYGARGIFKADFDPYFTMGDGLLIYQANATAFRDGLTQLLNQLADPEIHFLQTSDNRLCSYCPFNGICNR